MPRRALGAVYLHVLASNKGTGEIPAAERRNNYQIANRLATILPGGSHLINQAASGWLLLCKNLIGGGDVAGEKNLIPFNERTEEEQRRIATEGGIASGAARRRKKSLKEAADLYLSLPVSDKRRWNKIARKYVEAEDIDNQMAMIIGLAEAATAGDAKAAKVIIDLLGETAQTESEGVQIIDDC